MNQLEQMFSLEELEVAQAAFSNPYVDDPATGMALIARLLASPAAAAPYAASLAQVSELIHTGLPPLAAEAGLAGFRAVRELSALSHGLRELAQFPDLANKVVVGVGGSYSAGKSRFLNTLLGVDVLPEDLGPTTAVPTYLVHGAAAAIRALNLMQHQVELDLPALKALVHGFQQGAQDGAGQKIGLASLLRLLTVHEPALRWQHLALLDTPGHSKPDGHGSELTDAAIAREQLQHADHLVWTINARNGALRQDDIRFLQTVAPRQPVFFVLTQSDLQSSASLPEILRSVERDATAAGIACAGVMAWAAPLGEHFGKMVGGSDIRHWLDGLDLHPKLTDKRRAAAALVAELEQALTSQREAARDELALLNAFWPAVAELADEHADKLRQLVATKRGRQQRRSALQTELAQFGRQLESALTGLLEQIALADALPESMIEQQYQAAVMALRSRSQGVRERDGFAGLLEAARHGHAGAQYALAQCYQAGNGTPADPALAYRWYAKAAASGLAEAQCMLGQCHLDGSGVAADRDAALRWYALAAEQEHIPAQLQLHVWLTADGQDEQSLRRGTEWLKRAAQAGSAEAEYRLGDCYLQGLGVARNRRQASVWLERAAQQDHAAAQVAIGHSYLEHSEGEQDEQAAADWFQRAAKQGNAEAQRMLASCYLQGRGRQQNRGHAAIWYHKAHLLGDMAALTGLGHYYFASEDLASAAECYQQAAQQGDAAGRYWLGECYLHGWGVRKNRTVAARWHELAEEQGYRPERDPDVAQE